MIGVVMHLTALVEKLNAYGFWSSEAITMLEKGFAIKEKFNNISTTIVPFWYSITGSAVG